MDGMLESGNIDLQNRPRVKNADGSVSTVRSLGVNIEGQEVLIPTVSEDGRIMTNDQAVQAYRQTGRHLGKFSDVASSNAYAQRLHQDQERLVGGDMSNDEDFTPDDIEQIRQIIAASKPKGPQQIGMEDFQKMGNEMAAKPGGAFGNPIDVEQYDIKGSQNINQPAQVKPSNAPVEYDPNSAMREQQGKVSGAVGSVADSVGSSLKQAGSEFGKSFSELGSLFKGSDHPIPIQLGANGQPAIVETPQGKIQQYSDGKYYPVGTTFSKQPGSADPKIQAYATAHGLPYTVAQGIIQERLKGRNGSR